MLPKGQTRNSLVCSHTFPTILKVSHSFKVPDGGISNGSVIGVTTGTFPDGRDEWCMKENGNGVYQIENAKSKLVVDIADYSMSDGDKIHQWNYVGGTNQVWTLDFKVDSDGGPSWECGGFPQNTFFHIIAKHSGMALAIADQSTQSGANVYQYPVAPSLNDNWRFVPTQNGFYHVIAQHSGMALSVTGSQDGANVIQAAASGSNTDDWCFIPAGSEGEFEIRNRQSTKSLDIAEYSFTTGGNVHQWSHWGGDNQKFYVDLVDNNPPPTPPPPPSTPNPPSPTPPSPSPIYSGWGSKTNTPVVAVAAANLPDGRIVMWSSFTRDFFQMDGGTETWTATYNPNTGR